MKMINKRAKGNRAELLAVKRYESQGYEVYRVPSSRLYQKNQDMFHLWDILCICDRRKPLLVQVKTNKIGVSQEPFKKFQKKYGLFFDCAFLVYKRGGVWDEKKIKEKK